MLRKLQGREWGAPSAPPSSPSIAGRFFRGKGCGMGGVPTVSGLLQWRSGCETGLQPFGVGSGPLPATCTSPGVGSLPQPPRWGFERGFSLGVTGFSLGVTAAAEPQPHPAPLGPGVLVGGHRSWEAAREGSSAGRGFPLGGASKHLEQHLHPARRSGAGSPPPTSRPADSTPRDGPHPPPRFGSGGRSLHFILQPGHERHMRAGRRVSVA